MIGRQREGFGRVLVLALVVWGGAPSCARRETAGSDIEVPRAYIAEPVMGERAAMYFTVINRGDFADQLVGVSTPVAESAEIHRTIADGGMMRMEPVESLRVSPGEALHFAPGGYHVMLLAFKEPIAPGDEIDATLTFRRAGQVSVKARVIALPQLDGVLDSAAGSGQYH